jgi:hypothetical protein
VSIYPSGVPLDVLDRKQVTTRDQTEIECSVLCVRLETKFEEAEALMARLAAEEQKVLEPAVTPIPSSASTEANQSDATEMSGTVDSDPQLMRIDHAGKRESFRRPTSRFRQQIIVH